MIDVKPVIRRNRFAYLHSSVLCYLQYKTLSTTDLTLFSRRRFEIYFIVICVHLGIGEGLF